MSTGKSETALEKLSCIKESPSPAFIFAEDGKVTEPHKKEGLRVKKGAFAIKVVFWNQVTDLELSGTESNGPQVFSLGENDKKQWRHAQKS